MRRVLVAALLLGCGSTRTPPAENAAVERPPTPTPTPTPSGVAGHNEVCRDEAGVEVATCADGLSCCYPCGIEGCASVCHTPEECDVDRTRP